MNAILHGFDLQQTRIPRTLAVSGRLLGAIGHRWRAIRTQRVLDTLPPRQRRDAFGDPAPFTIGPRIDADPHAVRMLMHVGR